GPAVRDLLLAPGQRHRGHRAELGPDQLPVPGADPRLPNDRDPDGRHRTGGHSHGYRSRDPDCLLRGADREPADADLSPPLDGVAAVVELPGAGLRLAYDPLGRRRIELG